MLPQILGTLNFACEFWGGCVLFRNKDAPEKLAQQGCHHWEDLIGDFRERRQF
jgi:hypothetical protein